MDDPTRCLLLAVGASNPLRPTVDLADILVQSVSSKLMGFDKARNQL
jgi:hypothetical protein